MIDWLDFSPDTGLMGLFAASFLAATLLPGGSEIVLYGFLSRHPDAAALALMLATLGNTLGGLTSYACGRWLPRWQRLDALPHHERVARWGTPILLLSWVPLIGDALCVAAGWLRLSLPLSVLFMALGKAVRYGVVALGALP